MRSLINNSLSLSIISILLFTNNYYSQSNNNGKLDLVSEFTSIQTVNFIMPDGISLETDIYLPIISDSVTTEINGYIIEIIKKGTQLFVYDSIGNNINNNEYQLPLVFTRTPYSKGTYNDFGIYMNILGYAYALQDMRGRYNSEGVYLPMYSDAWEKYSYYPNSNHPLDITLNSDSTNGKYHQDGKYSIDFIQDSLYKNYDLDRDGINETYDKIYNGSIAMLGASALGNTQYQAASSIKNDVSQDGLKGLVPIVATNEMFNSVIQHNGVFRQALVEGWLTGQLSHNTDTNYLDNDIQNSIHSIYDYGNIPRDSIYDLAVDFATSFQDNNGYSGMYPNYQYRKFSDASFANVDNLGNSDINGSYNRYSNLELPIYHLTGWWDIFIDGQIDTYNNVMQNTSANTQDNQKLVIGPWTHGTIAEDIVGDITFPQSVFDLKIVNSTNNISNNLIDLVDGEIVDWLRYLLNYDSSSYLGEPKVLIPESDNWQQFGNNDSLRAPATDYYITYSNFINFLSGYEDLDDFPVEIKVAGIISNLNFTLPSDTSNQIAGTQAASNPVSPKVDYSQIPNVRFYVPGPVNDGISQNSNVGNYWHSSNSFPLQSGIKNYTLFFHNNGALDTIEPQNVETPLSYEHDPNNPVYTIGGGNLGLTTPQGNRVNSGPLNYADTNFAPYTMDRADVLHFESNFIQDSLCIIGTPIAKIYASSNPLSGPLGLSDADFFIRVLDVYPNGKEYFVVEGAVNARARDYAKQLTIGQEDINIPYSNINAGQVYEYEFNLLPIAYTFGHNHKIKILISSSNWPRYQSCANVPIEQGDFFRRNPGDGKTYSFNSIIYSPRIASQEINFSPSYPSQITFPLYYSAYGLTIEENNFNIDNNWNIFPNPVNDKLTLTSNLIGSYDVKIISITGEIIKIKMNQNNNISFSVADLADGIYIIHINSKNKLLKTYKFVKN